MKKMDQPQICTLIYICIKAKKQYLDGYKNFQYREVQL